jgi:hypothetical protein
MEGFNLVYKPQTEGIGDTFRNAKNRIKTLGSSVKQSVFGASEEQMFKNMVSKAILNKGLYNSESRYGVSAIKKIVTMISHGTRDPQLPYVIARLADNVLVDVVENALTSNSRLKVKVEDPEDLRENMDYVYEEIAQSAVKPLVKLGKTTLNDDRRAIVSDWWDKNVVPKMGKYFDALKQTNLIITDNPEEQEQEQEQEPTEPEQSAPKPVNKPARKKKLPPVPNPEAPEQVAQKPVNKPTRKKKLPPVPNPEAPEQVAQKPVNKPTRKKKLPPVPNPEADEPVGTPAPKGAKPPKLPNPSAK